MGRERDAVNHYRDLLVGSFMIPVLPPWFENIGVSLRDSGILHSLLGIDDPEQTTDAPGF